MTLLRLMWELENAKESGLTRDQVYRYGWTDETDKAVRILTENDMVVFDIKKQVYYATMLYGSITVFELQSLECKDRSFGVCADKILKKMSYPILFCCTKRCS